MEQETEKFFSKLLLHHNFKSFEDSRKDSIGSQ